MIIGDSWFLCGCVSNEYMAHGTNYNRVYLCMHMYTWSKPHYICACPGRPSFDTYSKITFTTMSIFHYEVISPYNTCSRVLCRTGDLEKKTKKGGSDHLINNLDRKVAHYFLSSSMVAVSFVQPNNVHLLSMRSLVQEINNPFWVSESISSNRDVTSQFSDSLTGNTSDEDEDPEEGEDEECGK